MTNDIEREPTFGQERISDDNIGALLAAVGNHENKALLAVAMQPGVAYSRSALKSLFNDAQGDQPAWQVDSSTPFGYCRDSLTPIGLVAKEIIDEDRGTIGFIKTDYGADIGDAFAGHLLDYSLQHPNYSLIELFGRTGTASTEGVRSPMGRIAIFGELLTRTLPVRASDLYQQGNSSFISGHLHSLALDGLVELTNLNTGDPVTIFGRGEVPMSELSLNPNISQLPSDIRDVLARLLALDVPGVPVTTHAIMEQLIQDNPDYAEYAESGKLLRQVNKAMRNFVKRGTVKRIGQFTQEQRSIINLSDEQAKVLEDCVSLIYNFQKADLSFLEAGRQKAATIINDPSAVRTLVKKARQASPNANMKSTKETESLISEILEAMPEVTASEIEATLIQNHTPASIHTIRRVLRKLEEEDQATKIVKGKQISWSLTD